MEHSVADIARDDFTSFPKVDPKIAEKQAKQRAKNEKESKKADATAKKLAKKPRATTAKGKSGFTDVDRERVILIRKCTQYFTKLKHKITVSKPRTWPSDIRQLRQLVLAIETDLASSGGIESASAMYITAIDALERVSPFLPGDIRLSGPQASLKGTLIANREQWEDLITEVAIQHCEWFMVSGVKRLMLMTAQMAMTVNTVNHINNNGEASEDLLSKGKDL